MIDFSTVINDLYPALGASGSADLVWWTVDELYQWIDESIRRLARQTGCFVTYYTGMATVASVGSYTLPTFHVLTIQCDLAGRVLAPATIAEIEALDAGWDTATGKPLRFLQDTHGLDRLTLHPAPSAPYAGLSIGMIIHVLPSAISASSPQLNAPLVLQDYAVYAALAEARGKESRAAMPEVANWCRGLADLLEQVAASYWGPGQP